MVARAEWQENSDKPCDTGSPSAQLAEEYPDVDFSQLDPAYPTKAGRYTYNRKSIMTRGIAARRWLRQRREKVIAVVSHSAFLRTSVAHAWFMNADYRLFDFLKDPGEEVRWVEWDWTASRGGGMARSVIGVAEAKPSDFGEDI